MNRLTVGLTLGKYAPLHRGHQLVIETALAEVDHLIVLVYDCPEVTNVPLATRAGWIRTLYPRAEVIECFDGPREVGSDPRITRAHDEYIERMVGSRGITHFFSSEFYGAHVSEALGAVDRRVDPDRLRFPVSGTLVRADPYAQRHFIAPEVYRDLIVNAAFVGGPSTGKTTLCAALAERHGTAWMPEHGREYWERHQVDRRLGRDQLVELAEEHLRREERCLGEANRVLFTDTNAITTAVFCAYYHGHVPRRLDALARACARRYSQTFLCADDIPFDDTWDRSGEGNRALLQRLTVEKLRELDIPCVELRGTLAERMATVDAALHLAPPLSA